MRTDYLLFVLFAGCGVFAVRETRESTQSTDFLSDDYIAKINEEQDLWEAGRNFDANTPLRDLKTLLGTRMDERDLRSSEVTTNAPQWPERRNIPRHFDARKKWGKMCPSIHEVLDQGKCGSCWAISAAQAFTDRYCIASKGKHKRKLSTGHVLTCCPNCGLGCEGGWESKAWEFFSKTGVVSGGDFNTSDGCQPYPIQSPCHYYYDKAPYPNCPDNRGTPDCHHSCTNRHYRKPFKHDLRKAKGMYKLENNATAIKLDIMTYGPVTMAFKTSGSIFSYKSGVYEPAASEPKLGGHAVKCIGWGVKRKTPYWLIMNSWNKYWGDHGLIKMKMDSTILKMEQEVYAALPKLKETT